MHAAVAALLALGVPLAAATPTAGPLDLHLTLRAEFLAGLLPLDADVLLRLGLPHRRALLHALLARLHHPLRALRSCLLTRL
jgi:hypothetical protein